MLGLFNTVTFDFKYENLSNQRFLIKNTCQSNLYFACHHHHHHHHLFLKRPFLPRSARVTHFSRYEASPHIPEHGPFRVQTKLNHIILYTFSPSLPAPTRTSNPSHHHISTGWHPINLHSYVPHAQTTSIYHASPPRPNSEHPKDCTRPHFAKTRFTHVPVCRCETNHLD